MKRDVVDTLMGFLGHLADASDDLQLRVTAAENVLSTTDSGRYKDELRVLRQRGYHGQTAVALEVVREKLLEDKGL
jgi:hypothetical protein